MAPVSIESDVEQKRFDAATVRRRMRHEIQQNTRLSMFAPRGSRLMAQVYSIDGIIPVVHPSAFVHPTAVLIGDVIIGPRCYVGPVASLRGDFGRLIWVREQISRIHA